MRKIALLIGLAAVALLVPSTSHAQNAMGAYARFRTQAAHTVPPSGYINVWCKTSDSTCYQTTSGGTDTALGGGGGGTVSADAPLGGDGSSGNHLTCATCLNVSTGSAGDTFYRTSTGAGVTAVAIGSSNKVLQSSGTAPQWASTLAGLTLTAPVLNGATSSGSTSFDLSGNSGTFKTTTGASTFGGSSNTFTNAVKAPAYQSTSSAPALSAGASGLLGTLASVSVVGTNDAGYVAFTSGTVGTASASGTTAATAEILKITFSGGYTAPTGCVVQWYPMGIDNDAGAQSFGEVRNNFNQSNRLWGVCSTTTCSMYFNAAITGGGFTTANPYKIGYKVSCF